MNVEKLGEIEVTNRAGDGSQRQAALVAGFAIVIMAAAAGFAASYVLDSLFVPGDAAATANNIEASELLFRSGIFGWLIILICDVLAAWGLYVFLKPVNQSLSLLSSWFRLIYTAVLGTALLNFVIVLLLISGADYLAAFETAQLQALVLIFLNGFNNLWSIGLVVFGIHLLLLGYLVLKSGFIPKIWAVLLLIASLGYMITNVANLLVPNYEAYKGTIELIFILPMILGELGLAFWLLFRGGKESSAR